MKSFIVRFGKIKSAIAALVILGVIWFVYASYFKSNAPAASQLISVTRGTIVETVAVTGNTTPVHSLDLAFESGGTIAAVNAPVGTRISAGGSIAQLDTSDLRAQLAQAQAQVDASLAKLQSLKAGTRPEDIAAAQANLAGAVQALNNEYSNVPSALTDAYAKANDAVRNQISPLFSGAETVSPQITFTVNNSQTMNDAQFERVQASTELNAWQQEIAGVSSLSPTSTLETVLSNGAIHMAIINKLLATLAQALVQQTSLSATTLAAYKTSLATAITEANSGTTGVNSAAQAIASQKFTVASLQATLAKAISGTLPEDIAAQQASVEQAQANLQSIQVKINKASLVSPIDGVVTVENAKVGQIASPGAIMASVISDNNLEIDANVPETDIGKLTVANPVTMTFDAFPGESFSGKLFYIDPAETVIQGVVDYKIKISLDKPDVRVKSGLTANLSIETKQKDNALILPQFAVLQTDQGVFVKQYANGATTQVPVTLGIRDEKGNVEIVSGVTEGEQVLNIGLK